MRSAQRSCSCAGRLGAPSSSAPSFSSLTTIRRRRCATRSGSSGAHRATSATSISPSASTSPKWKPKRVLVGDAGAILYESDRPGLDIIGLGGYRGLPFARAGVHGLPATLELIERIPKDDRPDVLAIFPTWWGILPVWFGEEVMRRFPSRGTSSAAATSTWSTRPTGICWTPERGCAGSRRRAGKAARSSGSTARSTSPTS